MTEKVTVDYGYTKRTYDEREMVITDYNRLEELKEEYIKSKQLTHSEKLLIEDFYNCLINNHF